MQKKDNNVDADIYTGVIKWICVRIMFIHKAKKEAYIDGLVQDCSSSSALTMELLQSGTKPLISTCYNLGKLTTIRHCDMSFPDTQNMKYLLDLPEVTRHDNKRFVSHGFPILQAYLYITNIRSAWERYLTLITIKFSSVFLTIQTKT